MAQIFSAEWMNQLKDAWNADPEVSQKLADIDFSSTISCGFKDEENPRGVFVVEKGICTSAGDWNGESPDWDMRADMKDWLKWIDKGIEVSEDGPQREHLQKERAHYLEKKPFRELLKDGEPVE